MPLPRCQSRGLTYTSRDIVYYGPHSCPNCGIDIARAANEFGGAAFTYPEGPIYPNTQWQPHICDLQRVADRIR